MLQSSKADWKALRGALVGCLALMRRKTNVGTISQNDAKSVAQSYFQNLQVQSLGQHDRKLSFELLACLLEHYPDAVVSLGDDLVYGICEAIDGEKDPHCLLLTFRIVELVAKLFPDPSGTLASSSSDLFEFLGCYFPIHFTHVLRSPRKNSALTAQFSEGEIKTAIKRLGKRKASGLNGYTAEFLLKFWDLMKPNFLSLFEEFYKNGRLNACVQEKFLFNSKEGISSCHEGFQTHQLNYFVLQSHCQGSSRETEKSNAIHYCSDSECTYRRKANLGSNPNCQLGGRGV
ncbi:MMS19 nucleotide excision repair protein-like protein isoform X4 [Cucumis melo var. makuwa]|uniref:MMS19 nucleotide excision repair protein n=1 Tax=Cucumis melo var. makuwa TaxID=1194695 RepID=A0A5A7UWI3_CUCMM|nr:MMS19 nucleotide excision repair protein-like protein isoform X4 [Cucumis melo var. makuwa]TYK03843.1 MMS19 nucleotide excision repair protein-like protein isoform X4 [Cucumis melo var. makuwa]